MHSSTCTMKVIWTRPDYTHYRLSVVKVLSNFICMLQEVGSGIGNYEMWV